MNATKRELSLVALFLSAMAVVYTWPLAAHLTSRIPGGPATVDSLTGLYVLTWGIHALANHPMAFFHANVFYPHPEALAFGDHMFGMACMMAPLQWTLANPVLTYNVGLLLTFVLGGLGMYLLARHITGSVPAGLLAALIYAFSGYRFHQIGQMNVLALHWLPWLFLIGHMYLEERHRRLIYVGAFFFFMQAVSCTFSLYFLFVGLGLAIAGMLYRRRRRFAAFVRKHGYHFAIVGTLTLVAVYPFYHPYLSHDLEQKSFRRTASEVVTGSADLVDLATVTPGSLLGPLLNPHGAARPPLFPGLAALILLVFLALQWRKRRETDDHRLHYYALLGLVACLFAFGPNLNVAGRNSGIPLPYMAAYQVVPGWWGMHIPLRFWILASMAVAVLAAIAYRRLELWAATIPRGPSIVGALLVLAAVELHPRPLELFEPTPPGGPPLVYRWLESTDPEAVVVEYPVASPTGPATVRDAMHQYNSTYHWHAMVDGVAGWVPPLTQTFRERMQAFPADHAMAQLRALHVDYVLVHYDEVPPAERGDLERRVQARRELAFEGRFGDITAYRFVD